MTRAEILAASSIPLSSRSYPKGPYRVGLLVRKMLYGRHVIAGLTLPYGHVLHDYLA